MIKVSDVLAHPVFSGFRVVCGEKGLNNTITNTGIFEWETPEITRESFESGDFIVTTLLNMKRDPDATILCIRMLIELQVAAIAIKTVLVESLPDDILKLADEKGVPILYFRDCFFDDIIFTIKSLLLADNTNDISVKKLRALMEEENPVEQMNLSLGINPAFEEKCLVFCCVSKEANRKKALFDSFSAYLEGLSTSAIRHSGAVTAVKGNNCIIVFYTYSGADRNPTEIISTTIAHMGFTADRFRIGYSLPDTTRNLKYATQQAMQSAYYCLIYEEDVASFSEVGVGQIIIPNMYNRWSVDFYNRINRILTDYDSSHDASLHSTLLVYAQCDGDIKLTAQSMFQHGNTIRYRLAKIKELLEISNIDSYVYFFAYAKLHKLYSLFDKEPII